MLPLGMGHTADGKVVVVIVVVVVNETKLHRTPPYSSLTSR
jgi:hypothetical protein